MTCMSTEPRTATVAIIDYGLGNLFSVSNACRAAGLRPVITSNPAEILAADAAIIPGVGAFGDAMTRLETLDLVSPLHDYADQGRPLIGICLGAQLMFQESEEFGSNRGLGFLEGVVRELPDQPELVPRPKVPHVGWEQIQPSDTESGDREWSSGLLEGVKSGEYFYFVHSFVVVPNDSETTIAVTAYGDIEFTSAAGKANLLGVQFHPERSGPTGILMYRNLRKQLERHTGGESNAR
jgi:glutamine amidotransferase